MMIINKKEIENNNVVRIFYEFTSRSRGDRGPGPPTPRFGGPSYTIWIPSVKFKS